VNAANRDVDRLVFVNDADIVTKRDLRSSLTRPSAPTVEVLLQREATTRLNDDSLHAVTAAMSRPGNSPRAIDTAVLDRGGIIVGLELSTRILTCSALVRDTTSTASAVDTMMTSSSPPPWSAPIPRNARGSCGCPSRRQGPLWHSRRHRDRGRPRPSSAADVRPPQVGRQNRASVVRSITA